MRQFEPPPVEPEASPDLAGIEFEQAVMDMGTGWSGEVIHSVPRTRHHRCKLPGWLSRRANDIGDGSVFQCDCGKKYVLNHDAVRPLHTNTFAPMNSRWPWIEHVDKLGPPPAPIVPRNSKGIVYGRGKAPTKPPAAALRARS